MRSPFGQNPIQRLKDAHSAALVSRFVASTGIDEGNAKAIANETWTGHELALVEFATGHGEGNANKLSIDHFAFNRWLTALIDRARAGDQTAYDALRSSFDRPLTGRIKISTHLSMAECRGIAAEVWNLNRDAILQPADAGGFHSEWSLPFHMFVFNAHIVRLIEWTRDGVAEAEEALRQLCRAAVADTICFCLGCPRKDSQSAADQTWTLHRDSIFRPPGEGGFTLTTAILFHTYVLNCSDWVRAARQPDPPTWIVPVPVNADGVAKDVADVNTPDAAESLERTELFRRVIWMLFHEDVGTPHQQLALALAKFRYGALNAAGKIQGNVDRTFEGHGTAAFYDLAEQFAAGSPVDLDPTDGFSPMGSFRARLRGPIQNVYLKDASNREWLTDLGVDVDRACVGGLSFKDFLRPSARGDLESHQKQMPDWCNRVITRIKKRFGSRHDLSL